MKGRKFKWQGWRNFRVQFHSSQLQKAGTKGPKIKWMGERNFRVHLSHWCTSCTCSKSNSDRHDNPWNLNSKPLTWGLVYSTHSGRFWYDELLSVLWVYHIVSLWCCKTMFCFECHVIWHTIPGKPQHVPADPLQCTTCRVKPEDCLVFAVLAAMLWWPCMGTMCHFRHMQCFTPALDETLGSVWQVQLKLSRN